MPDLNGVVKGIATLLAPDGVAIVEAPYVKELIDRTEFDTIYHEHLCYFSLTALDSLFRRHGLTIADVENVAIHGGTLRIFATPSAERVPRIGIGDVAAGGGSRVGGEQCGVISRLQRQRRPGFARGSARCSAS